MGSARGLSCPPRPLPPPLTGRAGQGLPRRCLPTGVLVPEDAKGKETLVKQTPP